MPMNVCEQKIIFFANLDSSNFTKVKVKLKQSLHRPWEFQEADVPRIQENWHVQVVSLSALRTDRLHPSGNIPGTYFS